MKKYFFLVLVLAMSMRADVVSLQDGSSIKGTVLMVANGKLHFQTSFAGELVIALRDVTSLQSEQTLSYKFGNDAVMIGSLQIKGDRATVASEAGSIQAVKSDLKYSWSAGKEDPAIAATRPKWSGEIALDIQGKTGNSESFSSGLSVAAKRETEDDLLSMYASYESAEVEDKKSKDRTLAGISYENFFSEKLGWYVREEIEIDAIRKLDFRSSSTAGLTYRFIQNDRQTLKGRAGLGYQYESFEDSESEDGIVGDLGLDHEYKFSNGLKLTNSLTYIPEFEDFARFTIYHDSNLNFPAFGKFSLRMGVKNTYRNEPPAGTEDLDTTYYSKLIYVF